MQLVKSYDGDWVKYSEANARIKELEKENEVLKNQIKVEKDNVKVFIKETNSLRIEKIKLQKENEKLRARIEIANQAFEDLAKEGEG